MCFDNGSIATQMMVDNFIDVCTDRAVKNDIKIDISCSKLVETQELLTGMAPECPAGKVYDGCATECSYMTCEQAMQNDEHFYPIAHCEGANEKTAIIRIEIDSQCLHY